jgi:hypothetical protein
LGVAAAERVRGIRRLTDAMPFEMQRTCGGHMRNLVGLLLGMIASGAVLAAEPEYKFQFAVRLDGETPTTIYATVPPGRHVVLQVAVHRFVDITTPDWTDDSQATAVHFIDTSSGDIRERAPVTVRGAISLERVYTICGSGAIGVGPGPCR